jgi:hypothetical protein
MSAYIVFLRLMTSSARRTARYAGQRSRGRRDLEAGTPSGCARRSQRPATGVAEKPQRGSRMTTTEAEEDRDELWAYGYSHNEIEAMDRFEAFEAGVIAGENQAYGKLKGWVLRVGDPRGGFAVIGPFPSEEAAESRASRWDLTDWWPIELRQRADGEPEERVKA